MFYKSVACDFERITKPEGKGAFFAYSKDREALIFHKTGFLVETQFNCYYKTFCVVVTNEKFKKGMFQKMMALFDSVLSTKIEKVTLLLQSRKQG